MTVVLGVIQHVEFEHPGLIAELAPAHGIELDVRRVYAGEPLPDLAAVDGLVVMGGPMGAHDDDAYPWLAAERELLEAAVIAGLPVLGVCLGAQLLAVALGGRVSRGPRAETGIGEVDLVADDPILGQAGTSIPVLHWHEDTFTIPPAATRLADTCAYPNQAFRFGDRVWGLQFHVELNRDLAAAMAPHLPASVTLAEDRLDRVEKSGRRIVERFLARPWESSAG